MDVFTGTLLTLLSFCWAPQIEASIGDRSPFYQKCVNKCLTLNCTDDGLEFLSPEVQPLHLKVLFWACEDECQYDCMWTTVHSFMLRSWEVPQFYGKWPFVRILGIQEPASVVFSLLNFAAHVLMIRRFRRDVRRQSPLYWLWHCYAAVCLNAWFWSAVFHTRDLPLTEKMDYYCAFSMVLFSFYSMAARFVYGTSRVAAVVLAMLCGGLFVHHVAYLHLVHFDYGYNMQANVIVGASDCARVANGLGWLAWANWNRRQQPYVWRCVVFVLLAGVSMLLEVADFPPAFWTIDAHSLWHLMTAILPYFFYRFLIEDCKYLKQKQDAADKEEKQKLF